MCDEGVGERLCQPSGRETGNTPTFRSAVGTSLSSREHGGALKGALNGESRAPNPRRSGKDPLRTRGCDEQDTNPPVSQRTWLAVPRT